MAANEVQATTTIVVATDPDQSGELILDFARVLNIELPPLDPAVEITFDAQLVSGGTWRPYFAENGQPLKIPSTSGNGIFPVLIQGVYSIRVKTSAAQNADRTINVGGTR